MPIRRHPHNPPTPTLTPGPDVTTPVPGHAPDSVPVPVVPSESTTATATTTDSTILNPQTLTIESTPGGVRVKLPTLVLAHVLSMAGVCGTTYQLARPDADTAKSDSAKLRTDLDQLRQAHNSIVERLARIETNTENIWEDLRDRRPSRRVSNGARGESRYLADTPNQ